MEAGGGEQTVLVVAPEDGPAAAVGTGAMGWGEAATALGKRSVREERWGGDEDFEWTPGVGVRCYMHGTPEDAAHRRKILRTSLLFMQLQKQVSDAVRWRHARDAREAKMSAEIAARHPVRFPDDEPAKAERTDATTAAVVVEACPAVVAASFEEKMKADAREAKARMEADRLPAPLTNAALDDAFKELPRGTQTSIEACIKCWRENKMAPADLLATVRAFASSSPALRKVFAGPEHCGVGELGEVATAEQMHELSRMAAQEVE